MMGKNINMSQFPIPYSEDWKLSEGKTADGKRFIRVPIAVLGEWKHPEYGDVKFTQEDFDEISCNWEKGVTGYEPPLYLGHSTSTETFGGEPAVAFLEKLYQEDHILFGEYDPVDEDVYEAAKKGIYRYSSAEVVRNGISKETGEKLGTVLVGACLTNRPFLTGMPRVEVGVQQFSQPTASTLVAISLYPDPETPMDEQVKVKEEANTLSKEMIEQFGELVKSVETLRAELDQTKQDLADAQTKLKTQAREKVIGEVKSLNLTAAVKDKYCDMLREEKLSDSQQEEVMSLLRELSSENLQVFTEPKGQHETAEEDPAEAGGSKPVIVNPYEKIISDNLKLAEANRLNSTVMI
jgi:hypothetical protein